MSTHDELIERLTRTTLDLCHIPSPIGHEQALGDKLEGWARSVFAPEQVVRWSHSFILGTFDDPRPVVALIGHTDTVPVHASDLPPRIEGDRLYGLGSSDMKGGLAVMMELAERLPRAALPYNVVWIFYEREEGPYDENALGPLLERHPELKKIQFGIALEPTDNTIQVGCVGSLHATVVFRGRRAHSARPWQGANAIHAAGPLLEALRERAPTEVDVSGFKFFEVASITRASGGHARNVVPDFFELNLNYRFAPGKSLERAQEDVRQLVRNQAEITFSDLSPSGRVCSDNPLFQRFVSLEGMKAEPKQAWTDVGRLSMYGIDAVNFGPGETAQAHQQNESASIAALGTAYRRLEIFLRGDSG